MSQHLLMIEDDARLAHMVGEYLGQSGFVISHAPNAQAGLTRLQSGDAVPDLVILDLMLPDMDGLEVCRRIRAMGAGLGQTPVESPPATCWRPPARPSMASGRWAALQWSSPP